MGKVTFLVFSAYIRKMIVYTNWKTAPIELTVVTNKLSGDIKGVPYHMQIKQFMRE